MNINELSLLWLHLIFSFFWNSQVIFTLALNRSTGHFGGSLCFLLKHTVVFFSTFPTLLLKNVAMMTFQKKRKNCSDQIFKPLLRCLWLRKTVTSNCKMFLKRFKNEIFNWNVRRLCLIGIARNWFEQLTKSALEKRLRKQFQDSFGLKALPHHFLFSE